MNIYLTDKRRLFLGCDVPKGIWLVCLAFLLLFSMSVSALASDIDSNKRKEHKNIRIVMSAAFVADSGIEVYDEIFQYLTDKLNRKISFISGFSYETINNMLNTGMVDVGFVCGLPYVIEHDVSKPPIELLVAPVMEDARYKNKPKYFSYIITNKDNKAKNFLDTRGQRFVYNDEISNSGYNMPRAYMISLGETNGFFSKVIRSGSHEESIRMVATNKADVSAIDSLVYDYEKKRNPKYVSQTKIIKVLGPAGIPPVVISTKIPGDIRKEIQRALLNMNNDTQGKLILKKAFIKRFTIVSDHNYDDVRKMKREAERTGFLIIK